MAGAEALAVDAALTAAIAASHRMRMRSATLAEARAIRRVLDIFRAAAVVARDSKREDLDPAALCAKLAAAVASLGPMGGLALEASDPAARPDAVTR